ncbi:MAG: trypsin-like serine protease, partial [Pirellulales bacterium]|nr:trypsin-like serine protease [Pirellulales bacterium]
MAFMRLPKFYRNGKKRRSFWSFFGRGGAASRKPRRLIIDPLEQRQLLTLTVSMLSDHLVNETLGPGQTLPDSSIATSAAQSMAVDHDGDFVVAYTRVDTSEGVSDQNVYARYYTDEVQRITLPGGTSKFSLIYGGTEIQNISITATTPGLLVDDPSTPADGLSPVNGFFKLTYYTWDGVSATPYTTETIAYYEDAFNAASLPAGYKNPAVAIQDALRKLGEDNNLPALKDVTVIGIDPQNYQVIFGEGSIDPATGRPLSQIALEVAPDPVFTAGNYPGIFISKLREPVEFGLDSSGAPNIPVASDPWQTANAIKLAFMQTVDGTGATPVEDPLIAPDGRDIINDGVAGTFYRAPVFSVDPSYGHSMDALPPQEMPGGTISMNLPVAQVEVTPVLRADGTYDPLCFEIRYIDNSGKTDQPEIMFGQVQTNPIVLAVKEGDAAGQTITFTLGAQPASDVTLTLTKLSGDAAITASPVTLTFTANDPLDANYWLKPHAITFKSNNDSNTTDGTATYQLSGAGFADQIITVNQIDNDKSLSSNFVVSDTFVPVSRGESSTFTVKLAAAPTSTKTVIVSKQPNGNPALKLLNPTTGKYVDSLGLTFTTSNWDTPQTVTINASADVYFTNAVANFLISSGTFTTQTIVASEEDFNVVAVPPTGQVQTLSEPGHEFRVNPEEPDNPYTVGLDKTTQSNPSVAMDADGNFVITWDSTVPDLLNYGSKTDVFAERFSPMGLFTPQGLLISNNLVSVPESTTTPYYESFTVRLVNQPLEDVGVNIVKRQGSDPDLNLFMKIGTDYLPVSSLTFTLTDWNQPQTLYLQAESDANPNNGTAYFDFFVLGMDTQTVTAKEIDTNSFILSDTAISVPEGGANTFSFHPATQPAADLTVTITGSGDTDQTASPTTLTFTVADPDAIDYWNKFQTVTVSAAHDDDASNGSTTFTLNAAGWNPQTVTATEADDDVQLMIPTPNLKVVEGGKNYFTVALAGEPSNVVYVDVYKYDGHLSGAPEDPDVNLFDPATGLPTDYYGLIFTPMNWYMPQTVTVVADLDTWDLGDRTMTSDGNARFLVTAPGYPAQMVSVDEIDAPHIIVTDSAGVEVNALTVWEPATSFPDPTIQVVLDTPPPTSPLTVTITRQGDTDISANPATLTFDNTNWNVPQTVTFSAIEDADNLNGIAVFNLYAPGYSEQIITVQEIDSDNLVTILDDQDPHVIAFDIQTNSLAVAEGGTSSFTITAVLLDPTETFEDTTVTITKRGGGDQDLMLVDPNTGLPTNALSLFFAADPADPNYWMNPQTVTVQAAENGAEDADTTDGVAQFRITAEGFSFEDISVTELDDDVPTRGGIVTLRDALPEFWLFDQDNLFDPLQDDYDFYSNTVMIRTLEGDAAGETFQMQVPLGATIPAGGLTVTITPKPLGDGSISTPPQTPPYLTYTFTAPGETWQFTITADEDADSPPGNGLANYLITAPGYRVDGLSVTSIDNDLSPVVMPQLVVSTTSLLVPEGGANTFDVRLSSWPDPNEMYCYVTITPETGGDAGLTATPTTLTFIIDNWEATQTVTINAAEDAETSDGLRKFYVSAPNLTTKVVQAVKVNNDAFGAPDFVISSDVVNVPEGGSNTFTVALASDPGGPITVTVTNLAGGDADLTASPLTLNFTSANYNVPQTVTVNAASDEDKLNGTAILTITAPGKTTQLVTVNEADDDLSNDVYVREGGAVTYPVKLSYQPASDVTVTVTKQAGGDADLTFTPVTLTFTPANWNHPQYVVFSAARDTDKIDGTASFVFSSSNYPAATDLTLNVAEIEDDVPDLAVSAAGLQVIEGGSNTFTVKLGDASNPSHRPTSNVTLLITRLPGSDADLVASPIQLLFTPGDYYTSDGVNHRWDLPQTVTISAAPDADTSNGSATFVVSDPSNRYHSWKLTATEIDKLLSVRRELVPDEPLLSRATYWDPETDSIQMDPYAFRVNTLTTNSQWDPTVGMDAEGNFVIAWCDEGQDWSYFNDIRARRFSADGTPLLSPGRTDSQEWLVNNVDTNQHITPYVAMSEDGHFLITWCMIPNNTGSSNVMAEVYDNSDVPVVIRQQFVINGGNTPTADWDYKNDYVIGFGTNRDSDIIVQSGGNRPGLRAVMYDVGGVTIRSEFQVNGPNNATTNTTPSSPNSPPYTTWSFGQSGNSVGIDADGDLTISYEGAGPDAYEGDPDFINEYYMSYYHYLGYSDVFLGYLRASLDRSGNLVRGESNGVMFTQWDTNPEAPGNSMNVLDSDSVANAQRDGINARYFVAVPSGYTDGVLTGLQGKFLLRLSGYGPGAVTVEIEPPTLASGDQHYLDTRDSGQGGMDNTALEIHNKLTIASRVGVNWAPEPNPSNSYDGPVYVRRVSDFEELVKMNTQWEYLDANGLPLFDPNLGTQNYIIYEIRFQGDVHSSDPGLGQIVNNPDDDLMLNEPLDDSDPVPYPQQGLSPYTASNAGEPQGAATIGMQPDGNFTLVWTQTDYYSTLGTSLIDPAGNSIFFRNFTETTDTAGPNVSGMYYGPEGTPMGADTEISVASPAVDQYGRDVGGLKYTVISFDEDMLTVDPLTHKVSADSVTNPQNYVFNGTGAIVHIEYGFNRASQLVQQDPMEYGSYLSPIPTNKWEVVLTFDANPNQDGNQGLSVGIYSITALPWIAPTTEDPEGASGLRDRAGNTLQKTGFTPDGGSYTQSFVVVYDEGGGGGGGDPPVTGSSDNGYTQPGSPGAVAADADGDHIVVWTDTDPYTHKETVKYRIFNANGTAASSVKNVFDTTANQCNATVACNATGDFVVTWTQIDATGNADIWARRFHANGTALEEAFRVNSFTDGNQNWSNVAMDRDGDFAVTWSSYGQEKNGQPGLGYGVYATRFNSLGQVEIPEFQVNTEVEGDQFHSSIVLTEDRWMVVAFEGPGAISPNQEIFVRSFDSKGSPAMMDYSMASQQTEGSTAYFADSRYPDIAASPDGEVLVVAWQELREDGTGWNIRARTFSVLQNLNVPPTGLFFTNPDAFTVNTTTDIDQTYPSVAVDYNGTFVIAWSGYGDQLLQNDPSGDGVFYRRYDATGAAVGGESRVNVTTAGDQRIASVASDAIGNLVIAFTGPNTDTGAPAGSTKVYKNITKFSDPRLDNVGPFVTEVLQPDGTRLYNGGYIAAPPVASLTFNFSEEMATIVTVPESANNIVTNLSNWILTRNGNLVTNAINSIDFQYDSTTRKYRAVVNFSTPLETGIYQLTLKLNVMDKANSGTGNGNRLNVTAFQTAESYIFSFTIGGTAELGPEFRINDAANVQYGQVIGQTLYGGSTNDLRESTKALAMDHDGDFVVVWTSYGQDDPSDLQNGGVYMRVYDRNDNPISASDILVNQTTAGQQRNASVAMDADGDFVVVWESQGQNPLQPDTWDVYMRRFDSMGRPLTDEIRVNTEYTGDQIDPSVAMNDLGQFVIVWATKGQSFSYFNDVHAQIYDMYGGKVGTEFRVNTINIPGTLGIPGGSYEANPTAAMDAQGNFVVAWEQIRIQTDGIAIDTYIAARLFDKQGIPRTNSNTGTNLEFRIDASFSGVDFTSDGAHREHQQPCDIFGVYAPNEYRKTARNPGIVMDQFGNFIVVWEAYQDNDADEDPNGQSDYSSRDPEDRADSYGVYFRRFQTDGTPTTAGDQNANFVDTNAGLGGVFAGDQINASIAMDVDGDFVVVWNGSGATFDQGTSPVREYDPDGIFSRLFHAANNDPSVVPDYVYGEARVNRTSTGTQEFPTVAMTPNGTYLVVWSGVGVGDSQGIFARRYVESTDNAGPELTGVYAPSDSVTVDEDQQWHVGAEGLQYVVVTFDEEMMPGKTGDGVENPANYRLLKNGVEIYDGIYSVEYGLCDAANAALWKTKYGMDGLATNKWTAILTVDGNGVAAGVKPLLTGTYKIEALAPRAPTTAQPDGISGLRDRVGNPLRRNGYTSVNTNDPNYEGTDDVELPSFTLVVTSNQTDQPVTDTGISPHTDAETRRSVAVDQDGDSIIVWTATVGSTERVFMGRYDANGDLIAGSVQQVTAGLSAFANDQQRYPTVACDADGDFVVTWTNTRNGNADVYMRRFDAAGNALSTPDKSVNTYTQDAQQWSSVAMDSLGNYVITWTSYGQEDNGQGGMGYGVYAQRYNISGIPLGGEFRVNVTTAGDQMNSNVALADSGHFVIVWQSSQNGMQFDIVAREYNADGTPAYNPLSTLDPNSSTTERVINSTQAGNQCYPDVAIYQGPVDPEALNPQTDPDLNQYVVTWQSQGSNGWDVYSKQITSVISKTYTQDEIPNLLIPNPLPIYDYSSTPPTIIGFVNQPVTSTLKINDHITISDINVSLTIKTQFPEDLEILLIAPWETNLANPDPANTVELANRVPQEHAGSDFNGTVFDDQAPFAIDDFANAKPPFTGNFQPTDNLNAKLAGQDAYGTWTLVIIDHNYTNSDVSQYLDKWSLEVTSNPSQASDTMVNTTSEGDQLYPSIAMARDGSYTIAWSGRGDQPSQEDTSGVFYQRFDSFGSPIGSEVRVNQTVSGYQGMASVGSSGAGNIVIAYTGVDNVYRFTGLNIAPVSDKDGPVVSDVMLTSHASLLDGSVVGSNVSQLLVAFGEDMCTDGASGTNYTHSVLNPDNWRLYLNGNEIVNAVTSISFQLNAQTRQYEATLSLDGNGVSAGIPVLQDGNYTLVLSDRVWDATLNRDPQTSLFFGNALDGDYDGVPGASADYVNQPGYQFAFTVATSSNLGAEFRVNQNTAYEQEFSQLYGTGFGREITTHSVDVDSDGDFAVVWTSFGQDGDGAGVYLRIFDQNKNALTNEIRVNTTTAGNQRNASVAVDADGDLVVVWESEGQDADGSTGVYARRFDAMGNPLGGEFRVNTNYTNDQINPDVAMDPFGNFVIVWLTAGQPYSYFNNVCGQLYNSSGQKVGSQFTVNTQNIVGDVSNPENIEPNVSVAMDYSGNFVVTWDQFSSAPGGQINGITIISNIMARQFDSLANPYAAEFQVNVGDEDFFTDPQHDPVNATTARNPQAAMDAVGNFIIAWEAYQDDDYGESDSPDSYGIYFRKFQSDGTPYWEVDHQANLVITDPTEEGNYVPSLPYIGGQVNPTVAIDVDGDYVVAWDGNGAQPNALFPDNPELNSDRDTQGVFLRKFHAVEQPGQPEFVSVQSRVNRTASGNQKFATVAMTPDGDFVVVWCGNGVGDSNGIFARVYTQSTDTAGPIATEIQVYTGSILAPLGPDNEFNQSISKFVVSFDEEMMQSGGGSVKNSANYILLHNGIQVSGAISGITFGLNEAYNQGLASEKSNKWEAVLTLSQEITDGLWQLRILNSVRDKAGNPLFSLGGLAPNGFQEFQPLQVNAASSVAVPVNTGVGLATTQSGGSAIAQGDTGHVVAWANSGSGQKGVYANLYQDVASTVNGQREVTSTLVKQILVHADPSGSAADVAVAQSLDGDFIVVWSANNSDTDYDVYAQRYDATGTAMGLAFLVNTYTTSVQCHPAVAMDADGDFAVTWQSLGQEDTEETGVTVTAGQGGYGIYAQRYSRTGVRLGGVDELQVITFVDGWTGTLSLRWDHDSDDSTADVILPSIQHSGNLAETGKAIEAAMKTLGVEVETEPEGESLLIRFTGAASGATDHGQLRVNTSATVKTGGESTARIQTSTTLEGETGEFRVNDTTTNNQVDPSIAMDDDGDFVISWTSYGQADPSNSYSVTLSDGTVLSVQLMPDDSAIEGNIYAKKFDLNELFYNPGFDPSAVNENAIPSDFQVDPYISTTDNPANHIVEPDDDYEGVVQVLLDGEFGGTGTLLWDNYHILTAAHVVWDSDTGAPSNNLLVQFDLESGPVIVVPEQIFVYPGYNGNPFQTTDLAIIVLSEPAPAGVQGYDIYRSADEVGQVFDIYGYGLWGSGISGAVNDPDGNKRYAQNQFDGYGDQLDPTFNHALLIYDFDDGTTKNDTLGRLLGVNDVGVGLAEGCPSHGDSGGPSFINGKIAAVTTGGPNAFEAPEDTSGFGQIGANTRVSIFADWVDYIVGTTGSSEFLVNANSLGVNVSEAIGGQYITFIDNVSGSQTHSSVAMDADGDFVITWTSYGQDAVGTGYGAGADGLNGVFARRFSVQPNEFDSLQSQLDNGEYPGINSNLPYAASDVFRVSTFGEGNQQLSKVSMDADGDFVVTWESFQDDAETGTATSYGVYAKRYVRTDQVGYVRGQNGSSAFSLYDPLTPRLWRGTNSLYAAYGTTSLMTLKVLDFNTLEVVTQFNTLYLSNGEMSGEIHVADGGGNQRYPSVDSSSTGDFTVVWTQENGIYERQYLRIQDSAGPRIADVLAYAVSGTKGKVVTDVIADTILSRIPSRFIVTFSEPVSTSGGDAGLHSVLNTDNWQLIRNEEVLGGAVVRVDYGLNMAHQLGLTSAPSGKYEAVLTVDGDPTQTGAQSLLPGNYSLTLSDAVWDTFNNKLDGDADGAPGGEFIRSFGILTDTNVPGVETYPTAPVMITLPGEPEANPNDDPDLQVNTTRTGDQTDAAVASYLGSGNDYTDGRYVVVWVTTVTTDTTTLLGAQIQADPGNIVGQIYNRFGEPLGSEFVISSQLEKYWYSGEAGSSFYYLPNGAQVEPTVAMDNYGNFVVVWAGEGGQDANGIYARIFDCNGVPLTDDFLVNQTTEEIQNQPSVAMDANGDIVVTWTNFRADTDRDGIFFRKFDILGRAQTAETLVNTYMPYRQQYSDVAMDDAGNFVVVWESDQQDGSTWGVYGQLFNAAGGKIGGEFHVTNATSEKQFDPHVARSANGDFVVSWTSNYQDGSGYGVYARRFSASGAPLASEFLVNATTANWQYQSDVAMDDAGHFVVTWSGYRPTINPSNDPLYDVFARIYNFSDGSDYAYNGEFRVNQYTPTDQLQPAVTMDRAGNMVVAWSSDNDVDSQTGEINSGLYQRIIALDVDSYLDPPAEDDGQVTPQEATFTLTGPTSGTYTAGQNVTVTWTATNVPAGSVISLCLDQDLQWMNGNERWIEIDKVAAVNGNGSYTFDPAGIASGTYYVSGYLYNNATKAATVSQLTSPITISNGGQTDPNQPATFTLSGPTSGTYTAGQNVTVTWTATNVPAGSVISLCLDQ